MPEGERLVFEHLAGLLEADAPALEESDDESVLEAEAPDLLLDDLGLGDRADVAAGVAVGALPLIVFEIGDALELLVTRLEEMVGGEELDLEADIGALFGHLRALGGGFIDLLGDGLGLGEDGIGRDGDTVDSGSWSNGSRSHLGGQSGLGLGSGLTGWRLGFGLVAVTCEIDFGVGETLGALLVGLVDREGIEETDHDLRLALVADKESLLLGVADEANLGEHRGHGRLVDDEKFGLLDAAVDGVEVGVVLLLHVLSEVEAFFEVGVLVHSEHHIALGRVGVEALVGGIVLIVGLEEDVGVFLFSDLHVGLALGETHHESLDAGGRRGGMGVGVDGDEEVGLGLVGHVGALGESDVLVGGTGVEHFDIGVIVLDEFAEFFRDREDEVFLLAPAADGAGFVAPVTGVDHDSFHLTGFSFLSLGGRCDQEEQQNNTQ